MSEYQFYDFRAIDRTLDEAARAELRRISSRAEITASRMVNEYHFGSFKGNADRLMEQFFDAHFYLANWGTRRLMLRLPARAFPLAAAKPYLVPDVLLARQAGEHVILGFHTPFEDSRWDDGSGEGWLDDLLPLRAELLAGDLRSLYVAWLAAADSGEVEKVDDDTPEPPVPPGLGELSASLKRLVEMLWLDGSLVEAAAAASQGAPPGLPTPADLAAWVAQLPVADKDAALAAILSGEAVPRTAELLRRFREDMARLRPRPGSPARAVPRTVGELRQARDRLAEEKKRRAAQRRVEEEDRQARVKAAARARQLDVLAGREEDLWSQVEEAVATKKPKEYERAADLVKDLHDLAVRASSQAAFLPRLRDLRERHAAKRTFLNRLDNRNLPQ